MEQWKDIKGWEGFYQVSDHGRVKSLSRNVRKGNGTRTIRERILKPQAHPKGRLQVRLYTNGVGHTFKVHRLVLAAFIGPCPEGLECCHNDGDYTNNCVENLRWDTRKSNAEDMVRDGTSTKGVSFHMGEDSVRAKLTEAHVLEIRRLFATGQYTKPDLGALYGVSRVQIYNIVTRKQWKHI